MKSILILILIMIHTISYSGTIDPNVEDQKYIDYGSKFKNVLSIEGKNKKNEILLGSCVLIDKTWILTAAHVSSEMTECGVRSDGKLINVDKIIIHKDFNIDKFGKGDISICHISQEILLDFYPDLYSENDEIDQICSMAGFGFSGTFISGSKFSDGKRRAGSNYIDTIQDDLLICSPSLNNRKTSLEFLIAHGDSGGGLFIGSKLAGINSCVMTRDGKPNSSYNDESGHTRISRYKTWIMETIKNYEKE